MVTDAMIEAGERTYRCPPGGVLRSHGELCRQIYLAMHAARPTADLGEDGELVRRLRQISGAAFPTQQKTRNEEACAEAADRLILYREARDQVEQVISAWAFAHNIDGALRNDLFERLRREGLSRSGG